MVRMSKYRRRSQADRRRRLRGRLVAVLVGVGLLIASAAVFRSVPTPSRKADGGAAPSAEQRTTDTVSLSDAELQRSADALLGALNPDLPENEYFTEFAKEKLRWMAGENAAGRLTVAFFIDPVSIGVPSSVMMAATRLDGEPTIFIAKPRFERFLREAGRTRAPFTQQQKNDFAVAIVHETVHLQDWAGKPSSERERVREESRVWHEVTLRVVRPWRAARQPLHPRFLQVDDAFRSCGDVPTCGAIGRFVTLTP